MWRNSIDSKRGSSRSPFLWATLPLIGAGVLLVFFFASLVDAQVPHENAYLQELHVRATELGLASDPQWQALLHITSPSSKKSEVDDPAFFLSPQGKWEPSLELLSTVESFFDISAGEQSTQCRFVARYRWLKRVLQFDARLLPEFHCSEFQSWRDAINPYGLTLIFPASFLNNPTSAFGHTLVRIDSVGRSDDESLPDYTANYAAETHGENAFNYALQGTVGGYFGYFSVAPYYEKVKKYSDLENRDIWEYQLNFTPRETELVVQHLWELRRIGFEYYYFDENCAYELLSLLKVARPSLDLYSSLPPWVIPVDTVRVLAGLDGVIKNRRYRPSAATQLGARMKDASKVEVITARALADGTQELAQIQSIPAASRAKIIDLAYDYLTYKKIKARDESPELKTLGYSLLRARSQTGVQANPVAVTPPSPPEAGHRTFKSSARVGVKNDREFYEIGVRPAYHDLLDPGVGYTSGAQIKFFDLTLRQEKGRHLEVHDFTALDILSIAPQNEFFHPWSWHLGLGLRREWWSSAEQPLVGASFVKIGKAFSAPEGIAPYLMVGPDLKVAKHFDNSLALGVGPELGVVTNSFEPLAAKLYGSWSHYDLGESFQGYAWGGELRYSLNTNFAVRASITRAQELRQPATETALSIEWFP